MTATATLTIAAIIEAAKAAKEVGNNHYSTADDNGLLVRDAAWIAGFGAAAYAQYLATFGERVAFEDVEGDARRQCVGAMANHLFIDPADREATVTCDGKSVFPRMDDRIILAVEEARLAALQAIEA